MSAQKLLITPFPNVGLQAGFLTPRSTPLNAPRPLRVSRLLRRLTLRDASELSVVENNPRLGVTDKEDGSAAAWIVGPDMACSIMQAEGAGGT